MASATGSRAWRLTFAYDGENFTLESTRKLIKRVPPGQPLTERSGRFIEVRGANRQVLYRRAITELLPENIEYRTGNPEQPLGRTPAPRRGEISLLVPDLADGRSAALVVTTRTGPDGERLRTGASQDIARSTRSRDLITIDLPRNGGDQ